MIALHAAALSGLLAYQVSPRLTPAEAVIEASIIPDASQPEATDPVLPNVVDWQPVLPDVPLPHVAMDVPSNAITLPPPVASPRPAAPLRTLTSSAAPPLLDAQSVGYVVAPAPRYPPASRRLREEGEVLVRVLIDVDGRPADVKVQRSSGHARLDEAAIEAVRAALFRPYVNAGLPRTAYVIVPVEFALRRG